MSTSSARDTEGGPKTWLLTGLVLASVLGLLAAIDRAVETWADADAVRLLGVHAGEAIVFEVRYDTGIEHARIGAGQRLLALDLRTGAAHAKVRANGLQPLLLRDDRLWVDHDGLEALDPARFTVVEAAAALAAQHPELRSLRTEDREPCVDVARGRIVFQAGDGAPRAYELARRALETSPAPCERSGSRGADVRAQLPDGGFLSASALATRAGGEHGAAPTVLLAGVGDLPLVLDDDVFLLTLRGRGDAAQGQLSRLSMDGTRVAWTSPVPLRRVEQLALTDGVLLLSGDGRVVALELRSGAFLWSRP